MHDILIMNCLDIAQLIQKHKIYGKTSDYLEIHDKINIFLDNLKEQDIYNKTLIINPQFED